MILEACRRRFRGCGRRFPPRPHRSTMKNSLLLLPLVVAAGCTIRHPRAPFPATPFREVPLVEIPADTPFHPDVIAALPEGARERFRNTNTKGAAAGGEYRSFRMPEEVMVEAIRAPGKLLFLAFNFDPQRFPRDAAGLPPGKLKKVVPTTAIAVVNGTPFPLLWNGAFFSVEVDDPTTAGQAYDFTVNAYDGDRLIVGLGETALVKGRASSP